MLFDFASAFPSMSQDYMFKLLTALGVPRNALNMVQAIYDNSRCAVQSNGTQVDGFKMTAGVRQGCPLSPLLYAICAELLIERLRLELPSAVIRAYADHSSFNPKPMDRRASLSQDIHRFRQHVQPTTEPQQDCGDTALPTAQLKHDQGQSDKVYTTMGGCTTLLQRTLLRLHTRTASKRHELEGTNYQIPTTRTSMVRPAIRSVLHDDQLQRFRAFSNYLYCTSITTTTSISS